MLRQKPARTMTDDELSAELESIGTQWDQFRAGLEESGGMSGSPGEWMVERMDEIKTEKTRRLISLDGDIGRREPR